MLNEKIWIIALLTSILAINFSQQGVIPGTGAKKNDKNSLQNTEVTEVVLSQDCIEACDDSGCLIFCPQPARGVKRCTSSSLDKRACCSTDGALSPVINDDPAPLVTLRQRRLPPLPRSPNDKKNLLKLNPKLQERLAGIKNSLSKLKELYLDLIGRKQATKCKNGIPFNSCFGEGSKIPSNEIRPKTPPLVILPKNDKIKKSHQPVLVENPLDENVSYEIYFPVSSPSPLELPKSDSAVGDFSGLSENSEIRSVKSIDTYNSETYVSQIKPSIVQSSEHLVDSDLINKSNDFGLGDPEITLDPRITHLKNNPVTEIINTDELSTESKNILLLQRDAFSDITPSNSKESIIMDRIYSNEEISIENSPSMDLLADATTKMTLISKTPLEIGSTEQVHLSNNQDELINIDGYIFPTESPIFAKTISNNYIKNTEFKSSDYDTTTIPKLINTEVYTEEPEREPKSIMDENYSFQMKKKSSSENIDQLNKEFVGDRNSFTNENRLDKTTIEDEQSGPNESTTKSPMYDSETLKRHHFENDTSTIVSYPSEVQTTENLSLGDLRNYPEPLPSSFIPNKFSDDDNMKLHHPQLAEVVKPISQDLISHASSYDLSDPLKQIDTEQHVPLDIIYRGSPLHDENIITLNSTGNEGITLNENSYILNFDNLNRTNLDDSIGNDQSDNVNENNGFTIFPRMNTESNPAGNLKVENNYKYPLEYANEQNNFLKEYERVLFNKPDLLRDFNKDRENENPQDFEVIHFEDVSPSREKLLIPYSQVLNEENRKDIMNTGMFQGHKQITVNNDGQIKYVQQEQGTGDFSHYLKDLTEVIDKNNTHFLMNTNKARNTDSSKTNINSYQIESNVEDLAKNGNPILTQELQKDHIDDETHIKMNKKQNFIDEDLLKKLYEIIKTERLRGKKHTENFTSNENVNGVLGEDSVISTMEENEYSIKSDNSFDNSHSVPITTDSTQETLVPITTDSTQETLVHPDINHITEISKQSYDTTTPKNYLCNLQTMETIVGATEDGSISENRHTVNSNDLIKPHSITQITLENTENNIDKSTLKSISIKPLIELTTVDGKENYMSKLTDILETGATPIETPTYRENSNIYNKINEQDKMLTSNSLMAAEQFLNEADNNQLSNVNNTLSTSGFFSDKARSENNHDNMQNVTYQLSSSHMTPVVEEEIAPSGPFTNTEIMQPSVFDAGYFETTTTKTVVSPEILSGDVEEQVETLVSINDQYGKNYMGSKNTDLFNNEMVIDKNETPEFPEFDSTTEAIRKPLIPEFIEHNLDEGKLINGEDRDNGIDEKRDELLTIKSTTEVYTMKEEEQSPTLFNEKEMGSNAINPDIVIGKEQTVKPIYDIKLPDVEPTIAANIQSNDNFVKTIQNIPLREIVSDNEFVNSTVSRETENLDVINGTVNNPFFRTTTTNDTLDFLSNIDDARIAAGKEIGNNEALSEHREISPAQDVESLSADPLTETITIENQKLLNNGFYKGKDAAESNLFRFKNNTVTDLMFPIVKTSRELPTVSKQTDDIQESSDSNYTSDSSTTEYSIDSIINGTPEKTDYTLNENMNNDLLTEIDTPKELKNDEAFLEPREILRDETLTKLKPENNPFAHGLNLNEHNLENENTQFLELFNDTHSTADEHFFESSGLISGNKIMRKNDNHTNEYEASLKAKSVNKEISLKITDSNHNRDSMKSLTNENGTLRPFNNTFDKDIAHLESETDQNHIQILNNEEQILNQQLYQRSTQNNIGPEVEVVHNTDEIDSPEPTHLTHHGDAGTDVSDEDIHSYGNYEQHKINANNYDLDPLKNLKKIETSNSPDHSLDTEDSEAFRNLNVLYKGEIINRQANFVPKKQTTLIDSIEEKNAFVEKLPDNNFDEHRLSPTKIPHGPLSDVIGEKINNNNVLNYAQQPPNENTKNNVFEALKYKIPIEDLINKVPDTTISPLEPSNTCSCNSIKSRHTHEESKSGHLIGNIIKSVNPRSPIYIFVDKHPGVPNPSGLPSAFHQNELVNINEKDHVISIRQIPSHQPKYTYEFVNGQYVRVLQNDEIEGHTKQNGDTPLQYFDANAPESESQVKSHSIQKIPIAQNIENPSEDIETLNEETGIEREESIEHGKQTFTNIEQQVHTEKPILIENISNIQDLFNSTQTYSNHKDFNGKEYYIPVPIYIYIRSK